MGGKKKGICIMSATVSFVLCPTKVPLLARERFEAEDGYTFRQYFRWVPWGLWRGLWQMRGEGKGNNTSL